MMINVGLFCGGYSSEYEISIKSARNILQHIPRKKYNPFIVRVTPKEWVVEYKGEEIPLNRMDFTFVLSSGETIKMDCAHIYIHGNPGENGKLQAYFEMNNIPFINSSALSSELSFDKWFCNQFLRAFEVDVAPSILLTNKKNINTREIGERLGFPLFVKPADVGSSYGISKVYKEEDLITAINGAFKEGKTVVCEAFLDGVEATCSAYRTADGVRALPCTEIVPEADFFDYEAKYLGKSQEITPARVSDAVTRQMQDLTIKVYQLFQMRSIARVDFMIVNNRPFVIEVNSIPGFTEESLVPKMLDYEGISISDFWEQIYDFEMR